MIAVSTSPSGPRADAVGLGGLARRAGGRTGDPVARARRARRGIARDVRGRYDDNLYPAGRSLCVLEARTPLSSAPPISYTRGVAGSILWLGPRHSLFKPHIRARVERSTKPLEVRGVMRTSSAGASSISSTVPAREASRRRLFAAAGLTATRIRPPTSRRTTRSCCSRSILRPSGRGAQTHLAQWLRRSRWIQPRLTISAPPRPGAASWGCPSATGSFPAALPTVTSTCGRGSYVDRLLLDDQPALAIGDRVGALCCRADSMPCAAPSATSSRAWPTSATLPRRRRGDGSPRRIDFVFHPRSRPDHAGNRRGPAGCARAGHIRRTGIVWTLPLSANRCCEICAHGVPGAGRHRSDPQFATTVAESGSPAPARRRHHARADRDDDDRGPAAPIPADDLFGVSPADRESRHLAYANRAVPTERPDIGYAMVFPTVTVAKILFVQIRRSSLLGS